MVQGAKQVCPQRFRETLERCFKDSTVGDVYEHRPGKSVTKQNNHLFTLLTINTQSIHCDRAFGAASQCGQNLAASPYTLALLIGMRP